MAIDRYMQPGPQVGPNPLVQELELIRQQQVEARVTPTDDGGVVVDFDPRANQPADKFGDNLVDFIEEDELDKLSTDLIAKYEADERSREEWVEAYIKGLDLLGLKNEDRTEPWDGACGVHHPLLAEAVVRFQAQTIQEVFPASGPAKAKLQGKESPEKVAQHHRVVDYLNYMATTEMTEYRPETERLLFCLPLAGSAFRKVYPDQDRGRPAALFVPAEDLVVNYGASDLETCERATHLMRRSANQIRKMQVAGFYRDISLSSPRPKKDKVREKLDKLTGRSESLEFDDSHLLLEMMVDYNLPGYEDENRVALPYVITIDESSGKVLSIYRNWSEGDPKRRRGTHFVKYDYIPGPGFYGLGLTHLVGGIAEASTSLLRQLVDAGTINNLQAGFKGRGLRIKGDDTPLAPGEWRDVDVLSGKIADNLFPLPTKEPSGTLHQLLGNLVEEGRRFASAADVKAADMNAEAPVGTTLAILEREMKVISAVQARIHHSMGKELRLLANVIRDHGPDKYPYDVGGEEFSPREDFDARIDVIPVSDPNAGSMAQRIMQGQAVLQLSAMAPEIYDKPKLHRKMIEALAVPDAEEIVPVDDDLRPLDPVAENMNLIRGQPIKAFLYQDHESHITAHMAMAENPQIQKIMANHPQAEAIMAAAAAHVAEHVAYGYRQRIEKELGAHLPGENEALPEDIELRLSRLVAPAAQQLTGKAKQQEQAEENARQQEDPIIQMQQKKLDLQEKEIQRKTMEAMERIRSDWAKHQDKMGLERNEQDNDRDLEIAKIVAQLITSGSQLIEQRAERSVREQMEGFRTGVEIVDQQLDRIERNQQQG